MLIAALTVVCFSLTAIALSLCCLWIFLRKNKSQKPTNQDDDDDDKTLVWSRTFLVIIFFLNEVELLSRFHHPNVISLHGYSIENETGLVVYELMHNGSLENQLHGRNLNSELTRHRRLKIALDIARSALGSELLSVLIRDLKSSNILLDSNFNAKVKNFSLIMLVWIQLSRTIGYIAQKSVFAGTLTDMSDVYAFGVVLMELFLGRKAIEKKGNNRP
ncbi:probable receptor-like protein kinase At1g80640 [Durio zibethinus]|uniref:Probable receptor-like protein kinase At1g80640 n=1 Tax=Durio zibethinus TaxID=66656 RepID=A0A6P5XLP0_DURZI|nr:probable receptor-like protein kinase At1g80640 [Durio zibethinus]